MDPNKTNQTIPQNTTPTQPEVTQTSDLPESSNSKKILIIVFVLALLIVVSGALIFLRNKGVGEVAKTPTEAQSNFDDLQKEADSADVGSDQDLKEIDSDLNSL